jgi:hypothetical protein
MNSKISMNIGYVNSTKDQACRTCKKTIPARTKSVKVVRKSPGCVTTRYYHIECEAEMLRRMSEPVGLEGK